MISLFYEVITIAQRLLLADIRERYLTLLLDLIGGYVRAPASLVLCRRQAFRNVTLWYFRQGRVDSVYPTGTVFHPSDRRLLASFNLPLIFGRPVIVTER